MADKKKQERQPDINKVDEAIERHIDEMMKASDSDVPKTAASDKSAAGAKKISVLHDDAPEELEAVSSEPASTEPEKQPLKIAIVDHTEDAADQAVPATTETDTVSDEPEPKEEASEEQAEPGTAPVVTDSKEAEEPETAEESVEESTPEEVPPAPDTPKKPVAVRPDVLPGLRPVVVPKAAPAPEPMVDPSGEDEFADPDISKVVDDIVATESDKLLEAEDEKLAKAFEPKAKVSTGARLKDFFSGWLRNPITRWLTILLILGTLGAAAVMPTTRYYALNTVGVRSSASVQVIDQSTLQPLKDVEVALAGQTVQTNGEGQAHFKDLKLGRTELVIQKRAFAQVTEFVTIGWGSNPFGSRNVEPTGTQYSFVVTDYLSGKPIAKVAAQAGDADAQSDEKGQIKLTFEAGSNSAEKLSVKLTASGYRTESVEVDADTKQKIAVKMVPARSDVFITKRSGKYDVYRIDVDGKNEKLVLAGTGTEREDMTLAPHPSDDIVALVSTRDNKRNTEGYLLSTLTLINLNDDSVKTITTSEQIKLVNWVGSRLVYVQVAAGTSAANPNRQRLMSYDFKTADNRQLTATNYFNDVLVAGNKIYYAPSSTYQTAPNLANFYGVNADGTAKQTLLQGETWNAFRTAYDKVVLSLPGQWYELRLGSTTPTKLDGQPGSLKSHSYVDSPDGKQSLWVDNRDGKGVLLSYDIATKADKTIRSESGLTQPVRWLSNNTIVYRIQTNQETADYALNLEGGEPKKIRDVTTTGSVDSWYYY